jgi:endonuclease G
MAWRSAHPNWFVRGHLAMKLHAERLGHDAAHNTHTMLNAVPQQGDFNGGIWLDLENLTAAWANHFGAVWIIAGPVIIDNEPIAWLGDPDEFQIAIADALFKIVIRESDTPGQPDVLAFLYPQIGPGYSVSPYSYGNCHGN